MASLRIGTLRIDLVTEIRHRMMPLGFLFNDLTRAEAERNFDWLGPEFIDRESLDVGMAFQAFVIRAHGRTILVDTCNGNHKQRPTAPWQHDLRAHDFMRSLAGLGLAPGDIDMVLCTHLHCDHVGWNTRLVDGRWVPTFPNARYVMNRAEYDHYAARFATEESTAVNHGAFEDSVLPVVNAGLADFVDADHRVLHEIEEEVFLRPSPGHSFGHCCIYARAGQAEAIVTGDLVHHPIQFDLPDLHMRADLDPDLAVQSRRRVMEYCAGSGAFLLAGHIPFWSMAQVEAKGSAFRLAI
ncbi:MBL fold metallo-hydrolase [Pseudooceanicola sp.]|uniref:MBL fold metallo-hydrolase n=1 Tax=Pseudooceanicola sp. TaxID=1914328 RepID=UPI00260F68BE|nr:MBL fold metallo-hydrolase [Pseudooceanicola sp.]MDF1855033.1 MBL fold metallo-hydrolase [Pseudooceanicola sp.]